MKKFFLIIIALICFGPVTASAHDVLVVQGLRVKPHDEALRGFRSACVADMRKFYLADLDGTDIVRLVREEQPRLILAIGADALKKLRPVKDVPIVYLMVVAPQTIVKGSRNITGVSMNIPPGKYLDLLARISPRPKSVGVVYDPAKTSQLVQRAQQEAKAYGMELLTREVHNPRDVATAVNNLKGMVDAFWMLPDTSVVTPETVELFLLASQEYNIPVISFAGKYVAMGALAALDIDIFDQGVQAGEMAVNMLNGTAITALPATETRSAPVKINRNVAKKLGITLPQ